MFWPLIAPDGAHLAGFVHSWCYLPYSQGMINRGLSGSSIEDGMSSNSAILALYFDFWFHLGHLFNIQLLSYVEVHLERSFKVMIKFFNVENEYTCICRDFEQLW